MADEEQEAPGGGAAGGSTLKKYGPLAAIVLLADESLPLQRVLLDIGALMQTICLAALAYDLGTCIEGQGVKFQDVLREFGGIPQNKQIVTAIAIGYPNWSFPANEIETPREELGNISFWQGFD